MPVSVVLYASDGFYEPGNRWYLAATPGDWSSKAQTMAAYAANILADTWEYTRWVALSAAGAILLQGSLSEVGLFGGDKMPPKYCGYIRLNTEGPSKPSSKYMHGVTDGMITAGAPSGTYLTAIELVSEGMRTEGVCDSDGFVLVDMTFRQFSRRRHVRRVGE